MGHNFPCPIVSEKDLNIYEDYLNDGQKRERTGGYTANPAAKCAEGRNYEMEIESRLPCILPPEGRMPEELSNSAFFPAYLRNHIGKPVRVESLISNCLECRVGTLLHVGADYIVIKLYKSCSTTVCEMRAIKYVTVIHDGDMSKAGMV